MLSLRRIVMVSWVLAIGCSGDTSRADDTASSTEGTAADVTTSTSSDDPPPDLGDGSESESESGSESGADTDGGDSTDGIDCPSPAPPAEPTDSPRVLIIAPSENALALATHLQGIMDADPELREPVVVSVDQESATPIGRGNSMGYFYNPDGREDRLAQLAEPWTYVVLLESDSIYPWPELFFEGVRVIACNVRATGATPIVLMGWDLDDPGALGPLTYRVGNGTGAVVAPAGYAIAAATELEAPGEPAPRMAPIPIPPPRPRDQYLAAATLYGTMTGRMARPEYDPEGVDDVLAPQLAAVALATVESEWDEVHYDEPYVGAVELRSLAIDPGEELWFMDSGTSSEQIWADRMGEIVTRAGLVPRSTRIGVFNDEKIFDPAALSEATPALQERQYSIFFARMYTVDADAIASAGGQDDMQVQVWDRHYDSNGSDGVDAVRDAALAFMNELAQSEAFGVASIPFHVMFAKLKTMRPSVQLLSDGTHATYPVGYGLAVMSFVSRTGLHPSVDDLDADTELASRLGEETIRQLSSLSASGDFVPDDPRTRPRIARAR